MSSGIGRVGRAVKSRVSHSRKERIVVDERSLQLGRWLPPDPVRRRYGHPGDRDQSLVFDLYENYLPDLDGCTVLDLGSNAAGLSLEFARRGAEVTAVELGAQYNEQARYVLERFGISERVSIHQMDVYRILELNRTFDVVCYVGLSYHLRYPQLMLDMLSHLCSGLLVCSSQTIPGSDLTMLNRATRLEDREQGVLHGWEPTEPLFIEMLAHAGFRDPRLISTAPHLGEEKGRICGNRSYFLAEASAKPHSLPLVDAGFIGKPERQQ